MNFSCVLVDLFNRFCFTRYITLIISPLYILYIFACNLYIVVVCFIYSRTLAPRATVICWLYPTQNKFYLILSYLDNMYLNAIASLNKHLESLNPWIMCTKKKGIYIRNFDAGFYRPFQCTVICNFKSLITVRNKYQQNKVMLRNKGKIRK